MATLTSSYASGVTTYVITDQESNTLTVTALAAPGGITYSSSVSGLLQDGQQLLTTLMQMLNTGLRPNVLINTPASFTN